MATYKDEEPVVYQVKNFSGGYNSYSSSKTNLADNEFPSGRNVELDDNGSVRKTAGAAVWGVSLPAGYAAKGLGWLRNSSYNKVIAASGAKWYDASTAAPLSGVSFTPDLETYFCQALDRLYGSNGTDTLCYTEDGVTVTVQSNGRALITPVYFNQRLYGIETTTGRVWYSNSYSVVTSPPSYGVGDFGTFDTDLSANPKKNAGFFVLFPGSGVEPTSLKTVGASLYIYTRNHGVWEATVAANNSDGSVAHTIVQRITYGGSPSPRGATINGNDQWYFGRDGLYSYGEVAQYQSQRRTTKSGRVRSEIAGISSSGIGSVALHTYDDQVFVSYRTGSYNDRIIKFDNRLNAFSAPVTSVSVGCFLEYEDGTGSHHLLAGSSDPTKPYVWELESGTDVNGSGIPSYFETKSYDCGKPGLVKHFDFIDVFYSLVLGVLTYEVVLDETTSVTGSLQLGSSQVGNAGFGTMMFGTFPFGIEGDISATGVSTLTNDSFRIDVYEPAKKVSVRFSNDLPGEQFKIDAMNIYRDPEISVYET